MPETSVSAERTAPAVDCANPKASLDSACGIDCRKFRNDVTCPILTIEALFG
jgi:hypothetical protein